MHVYPLRPKSTLVYLKESDKSPTEDEEEEDEDEEEEEEEVHDTERVIRTLPKDHSSDVSDSVDDLIQKKVERGAEDDDDRANDAKSEDEASTGESEAGTESLSKNTQQMTSNRDYDKDEMKCEEEMETESTHNSSVCDSKEKSSSPFARSSVATDRGVSSSRTDDTMDVEIRGLNDQFGSSRTLKEQLESRMGECLIYLYRYYPFYFADEVL